MERDRLDQVPGAAVDITVGPNDTPWVVTSAHTIYRWNGSGWTKLPGLATDVAVGPDGSAWAIGTNQGTYKWNGTGWTQVPGAAVDTPSAPTTHPGW